MKAEVGKRYQHYKNKEIYVVLLIARHSETLAELVVYQGEYASKEFGVNPIWARPRELFESIVSYEGVAVPRFTLVEG